MEPKILIPLHYSELETEAVDFIRKNKTMVLATCSQNRVTARPVSIINDGLRIYFQTNREFLKYQQIKENPRVALTVGNMQMEGTARATSHPLENPFFVENYAQSHPGSFQRYSPLKDEVMIEIQPEFITFWKYDENQKPYRDFLKITEHQASREYYLLPDKS